MNNVIQTGQEISSYLKGFDVKIPVAPKQAVVMDGVVYDATDARSIYAVTQQKLDAAAAVQQFAETNKDDLEEGETLCDRFYILLASNCDTDDDGELSKEEQEYIEQAYNFAADYLLMCGASEEDVDAFLNDDSEEAAANIQELLRNTLPDGEDASQEDIDSFAFDDNDGSTESVFDSTTDWNNQVVTDAVYKKTRVIRKGQKVIVRKRVSGRVRLSPAQKLAVRKMHLRAHTGKANMRRRKSMLKREKLGMNKNLKK